MSQNTKLLIQLLINVIIGWFFFSFQDIIHEQPG
jgi:hypothetical protein